MTPLTLTPCGKKAAGGATHHGPIHQRTWITCSQSMVVPGDTQDNGFSGGERGVNHPNPLSSGPTFGTRALPCILCLSAAVPAALGVLQHGTP
jgi:hypothetical protein